MERLYTIAAFVCLLNFQGVEVANSDSLKVSLESSEKQSNDSNTSYVILTHLQESTKRWIKLKCEAEEPTRWIVWKLGLEVIPNWLICCTFEPILFIENKLNTSTDEYIEITKEKTTGQSNTLFVSKLFYNLTDANSIDIDRNFSCLFERHWISGRFGSNSNFRNMTGVAVEIRQSEGNVSPSKTMISIIANRSLNYYYVSSSETTTKSSDIQLPCSDGLSYDLKNGISAFCRSKEIKAEWKPCHDLDVCESMPLSYTTGDTRNCRGNSTNHGTKGTPLYVHDSLLPFVIYCQDKNDVIWNSFEIIYPNTGLNNSKSPSYYNSIDEALINTPSIAIVITSDTIRQNEALLHNALWHVTSNSTLAFAENETVEFACVAVRYIYMRGFQWRIGTFAGNSFTLDSLNQTYRINKKQNLIIVRRNITMNTKNYSWISCQGPIWNSEELWSARMNINVTDATPPFGELSHEKRDNTDKFTCKYSGWPKPKVTWIFSENVNIIPSKNADENTRRAPDANWNETRVIATLDRSYSVTCKLENLKETKSYTKKVEVPVSKTVYVVVIISSVLVCLITLTSLIVYWRYRKRLELYAQRQHLTVEEIDEFYSGAKNNSTVYEALVLPYNPEYEIDRDQLGLDGSILGSGQFGLVLKGSIGPLPVAVKTIKPVADIIYLKSLLSELKILQYVGPHRNIVNLIGANTANIKKREVFLVLDYCPNGNLVHFLRQSRDRFVNFFSNSSSAEQKAWPLYENRVEITLTTQNLIVFAFEIASAMDHLSSKNVIHGDLAARNVLVTADLHAKICDFGLAKQLLHYSVYVQKIDCPLPLRWMALESLQDMEFSLASDKWSYGICLWEIFSLAELPYPGVQWSFESYKMLLEGYRMDKPQFANDSIYRIMLQCWQTQPLERPTFQYIIKELKKEEDKLS